jgi:hypothetical protein
MIKYLYMVEEIDFISIHPYTQHDTKMHEKLSHTANTECTAESSKVNEAYRTRFMSTFDNHLILVTINASSTPIWFVIRSDRWRTAT